MDKLSKSSEKISGAATSRTLPFAVAGIVCFAVAFVLGAGGWYLIGTNHRWSPEKNISAIQPVSRNVAVENSNSAAQPPAPPTAASPVEIKKAPADELPVSGGVVELGGDETGLPAIRVSVAPFAVAETEVTNAQYAEFVAAADYRPPTGWKDAGYPNGAADEPVVGVSWQDANEYCRWLSKKLNAVARLPSEAEWELAARGDKNFKYPWGGEWKDEAVASAGKNRQVRPVKSFPAGRSPVGAYDMVGNVWEWTSDLFVDGNGKPVLFDQTKQRVIKGGSVYDDRKYLTIKARLPRPEDKPSPFLGFRYVIIRQ